MAAVRSPSRSATAPVDAFSAALSEFLGGLAGTTGVEELERFYLDGVRRLVPFRAVGLYLFNPRGDGVERCSTTGVSDFFLTRYETVGRVRDPVLAHVLEHHEPCHVDALMSPDDWRASDVYREVFRLHRMTLLMQAPIVCDGRLIGTLNFGDHDRSPPSERELAMVGALGRLVGVTIGAIRDRERLGRERDRAVAVLDLCSEAVVVSDLQSGGRRTNAAAQRLLGQVADADAEACVDELLAFQRESPDRTPVSVPVTLTDGTRTVLRMESVEGEDDPGVIVSFLRLQDGDRERLPARVGALLTRREVEVAELVLEGLRDAEVAERMFLSPYTVKQYLKSVYRKTGVTSRFELVRAVLDGQTDPSREGPAEPSG